MGATIALAAVGRNPNNWWSPLEGRGFRAADTGPTGPEPAKSNERAIVLLGEPGGRLTRFRILIFAEAGGWDDAAIFALEPPTTHASADLRGSGCW